MTKPSDTSTLLHGMELMRRIEKYTRELCGLAHMIEVSSAPVEYDWKHLCHLIQNNKSELRGILPGIARILCNYLEVFSIYLRKQTLVASIVTVLNTIEYTRDHIKIHQLLCEINELLIDMCPHKHSNRSSYKRLPNVFDGVDNDIIDKNYIIFRYIKYLLIFMMNRRTRDALGWKLFDL